MDVKALKAFGIMKSCHDFDSVVSVKCLIMIRDCYNISNEFVLHVPLLGHRLYDTFQNGFSVSIDALEMELRFPHHPMIKEWHEWWQILPSKIAPNSWRYMIAFLGECRGAGIVPTRNLFMACFRLSKGKGGYYLIAYARFRVGGTPSNNKGWKTRHIFISDCRGWGFHLERLAHVLSNVPPYLYDEESDLITRLKRILFHLSGNKGYNRVVVCRDGLSPAPRGTFVCLFLLFMLCTTFLSLWLLTCLSGCSRHGELSRSEGHAEGWRWALFFRHTSLCCSGGRDSGGVIRGSLGSSRRGCSEATCRGTNEAFRRRACKRTQEAEGGKPWD
ncbi:hypothetical protein GW17_00037379 [Ensete ventricosum]|nr:hypothetical protein GW17_00037379 [Ensete ventricosum]